MTKMTWTDHITHLRKIAEDQGVTYADIAARTGMKPPNVSRFFSLTAVPSLPTFLKIADALGVTIVFRDKTCENK